MNQNQIHTPNLAEVLYLTDRGHRVVDVQLVKSSPYQIQELQMTCEGSDIDLDHGGYLMHGPAMSLTRLPQAFDAVMAVVWRKAEAGLV